MSYADKQPLPCEPMSIMPYYGTRVDSKTMLVETCKRVRAGRVASKVREIENLKESGPCVAKLLVYAYTIYGVGDSLLESAK